MPAVSIVVPAYNVAATIRETLHSLLAQTFLDFEIIVVDDGATDETVSIVETFADPRIRLIRQFNRGLAGARNTGIAHATGDIISFCDSDDLWTHDKLQRHVDHFSGNPSIGLSYAGSALIDEQSNPLGLFQAPKLLNVTPLDILLRNPIGNGSAPMFRRKALQDIAYRPVGETTRDWVFDETFRQSEDIECWIRFALSTPWKIEGISGMLTLYRVNSGGLSASISNQLESWERMIGKVHSIAPEFANTHAKTARSYQLRYLARRAVSMGQGRLALRIMCESMSNSRHPWYKDFRKSAVTLGAAVLQTGLGIKAYRAIEHQVLNRLSGVRK
jgi:glycosyltransferase involved in cell wall biosynthesis